MSIKKPLDALTGLALLAVSLFLLKVGFGLPEYGVDALGPRFFPLVLIVAMAFLSLIVIVQSIDFSGKTAARNAAGKEGRDPVAVKMQWAFVGFLAVYIALLPVLGYSLATFGFCFCAIMLLGPKDKKSICIGVLTAVLTSAGLTYIFGHMLRLFLP